MQVFSNALVKMSISDMTSYFLFKASWFLLNSLATMLNMERSYLKDDG